MIELVGVSKQYDDQLVLAPLEIVFESAQTYVLLGPSGCGKSTLLRIIIGLIHPDSGNVSLCGEKLDSHNRDRLRHRVGYVIQDGGLFPHMTAQENVTLVARYLKWQPDRIQQRVSELADLTRFPHDGLNRYPSGLSGGQQQRVSLMRALMLDPDILLLDEPLGALDPMIRTELQEDLKGIFKSLEKTVVFVTHDIHEAAFFAHHILLMRDGHVVQHGTIHELVNNPTDQFVTQFVSAQRSNELPIPIMESPK